MLSLMSCRVGRARVSCVYLCGWCEFGVLGVKIEVWGKGGIWWTYGSVGLKRRCFELIWVATKLVRRGGAFVCFR